MVAGSPIEHRFAGDTGELCWFEWGDPAGQPVLLLHATGFHARCWDKVIDRLPVGVRVIAPDFGGHGRSYRPDSIADWSQSAADILPLIVHLGLNDIVAAGHSMGGNCLIRIAGQMPERFRELVLIDPVAFPQRYYDNPPQRHGSDPAKHPMARRRNRWESAEQFFDHLGDRHPFSLWDKAVLKDYCDHGLLPAPDGEGFELACPPLIEATAYMGGIHANIHGFIPAIDAQVTVMRAQLRKGEDGVDFTNSPTYPKLASLFARGEDMFLPELTHFIPMQAPQLTADVISRAIARARNQG